MDFQEPRVADVYLTVEWRANGMVWSGGQWELDDCSPDYFKANDKFKLVFERAVNEAGELSVDYGIDVCVQAIRHTIYQTSSGAEIDDEDIWDERMVKYQEIAA